MLRAFAEAAAALDNDDYRQAAIRNAEFVTRLAVVAGCCGPGGWRVSQRLPW